MFLTAEQIRAGRAMARMDQATLAKRAGISVETVKRLEGMKGPITANLNTTFAIKSALEFAGIEFITHEPDGPHGVMLRPLDKRAVISAVERQVSALVVQSLDRILDDTGHLDAVIDQDRGLWIDEVTYEVSTRLRNVLVDRFWLSSRGKPPVKPESDE